MSATKVKNPGVADYALEEDWVLSVVAGAEPGGDAVPYLWVGQGTRYRTHSPSDIKMFKSIIKAMQAAVDYYEAS